MYTPIHLIHSAKGLCKGRAMVGGVQVHYLYTGHLRWDRRRKIRIKEENYGEDKKEYKVEDKKEDMTKEKFTWSLARQVPTWLLTLS